MPAPPVRFVGSVSPFANGNGLRIDLFLSIGPYQAPIISQALELLYRGVILTRRICDVCHQRFCRRHPGVRQSLFRGMASPDRISEQDIGVGQSRVRRSVSWVFLDRSLKVSNRYLDVRLCVLSFICELGMVSWS